MDSLSAIRNVMEPAMRGLPPLEPPALTAVPPGLPGTAVVPGSGVEAPQPFESVLGRFVEEVNSKQLASASAVRGLLSGEDIPLHRVMIATEEASVSFQLMVEVRNKLLEAYQELMRMQV